jgi:hypothetical protein
MPTYIFISYARSDKKYLTLLLEFLKALEQDGARIWWDGNIKVGDDWDKSIRWYLGRSTIAVALVSISFLNSRYCTAVESRKMLEQRKRGKTTIVPIILSPCDWDTRDSSAWLRDIQSWPSDKRTIQGLSDLKRRQLYLELQQQLRRVVRRHQAAQEEGASRAGKRKRHH